MLKVEIKEAVGYLTLNRPKANALSDTLLDDLDNALTHLKTKAVKIVVISGEGRLFSAGADIKEFQQQDAKALEEQSIKAHQIFNRIENYHVPVIAALKGAALGGGLELALACHIRFAVADTQLGLPEIKLGIMPGYSGTRRLIDAVGQSKALLMILTGDAVSAEEGFSMGIINQVFSSESAMTGHIAELVKRISEFSAQSIHGIMAVSAVEDVRANDALEARLFGRLFDSDNAAEGIQAFIDKRQPNFH